MRHLALIFVSALILGACAKGPVTKNGPLAASQTVARGAETAGTDSPPDAGITEGVINGGGGKGVLCLKDGKETVEVLDLYEARVHNGLEIMKGADTKDKAIDVFVDVITRHFWNPETIPMDEYKKMYRSEIVDKWFESKLRFLDDGKKLRYVNDSHEIVNEPGCKPVQVAVYYDESTLLIDKALWSKMDWIHRIALIAHEFIYWVDRRNNAKNSIHTRKLIGQLFSTKGARPKADGVPVESTKHITCSVSEKDVDVGYFYAFESQKVVWKRNEQGLELVFTYLKNDSFLFRASAFLQGVTLKSMAETPSGPHESDLEIDTYPAKQSLKFGFQGEGRGQLQILDKATGTVSEPLDVSCNRL